MTSTEPAARVGEAARLRHQLADHIRDRGTFQTPAVEAAFRAVPRHLFLPEVDLETAYSRHVVVTKRTADGTALSSASQPNLVATMLEQLHAQVGQRILEIGTATGINAALAAELVGPTGHVVTVEIDQDLADPARTALTTAGYADRVTVVADDGAHGAPTAAPYDRIIVTAGARDIPASWWDQLTVGGRMVVPVQLHGSGLTRSIGFHRSRPDTMTSDSAITCGFVPIRGAAEHNGQRIQLADGVALSVQTSDLDTGDLHDVLDSPAHQLWTGITITAEKPEPHLDLWLATHAQGPGVSFGRLTVSPHAREQGLANPTLRWAGAALYDSHHLAYLVLRGDDTEELGLVAHGPRAADFNDHIARLLHPWDQQRPTSPTITARRTPASAERVGTGGTIECADTHLTVTW